MSREVDEMAALAVGSTLGPYELIDRLGSGGMGVVFKARDSERNTVVALKTLHRLDPVTLQKLKKEFRSVTNVIHPNLVGLYELMRMGGVWFFTMEYVEGWSLATLFKQRGAVAESPRAEVQPGSASGSPSPLASLETLTRTGAFTPQDAEVTATVSPGASGAAPGQPGAMSGGRAVTPIAEGQPLLELQTLRRVFAELAQGISALHAAGKLHRDIKPGNVVVAGSGRVVLLDFGLVTEHTGAGPATEEGLAGTPAYIAPEQVEGRHATEASDWYSLGVMLYEALCGRRPFASANLWEKVRKDAPPLPESPFVPEDLRALCMALLSRNPLERPGGQEILSQLLGREHAPFPTTASVLQPRALVGRQEQLAALFDAYHASRLHRAVLVHVHGSSGMGKSALLQAFLSELQRREQPLVLAGRCYERELVPYKAFDALIDELTRKLAPLAPGELQPLLPPHIAELACAFPVLLRLPGLAGAAAQPAWTGEQSERRLQAFRALKELLARLARRSPLVLHIDDLQWGDPDSFALLKELIAPPDAPPLLLLCSFRTDDASPLLAEHRRLRALPGDRIDIREVEVGPLAEADAARLAASLLGNPADPRVAVIAREARGNPFFLEEMVRYVLGAGSQPAEALSSVTLERVIHTRVSRLPESPRHVLEAVAVAGRRIAQGLAARAAQVGGNLYPLWNILRMSSLVSTGGPRETDPVECYHDRIRESVHASLDPERLRWLHQRLAESLEAHGFDAPEELARHYLSAGDRQKAARHLTVAADRAVQALAFEHAAQLYGYAMECVPGDRTLRLKRAEALVNAGRCAESAPLFLEAARESSGDDAFYHRLRACEQLLISGRHGEGICLLEPLLREVGLSYPSTPRRAMLGSLWWGLLHFLRRVRYREPEGEVALERLKRVDVTWVAGTGLANADLPRGSYFMLRSAYHALDSGEQRRVFRALADIGMLLMMIAGASSPAARRIFEDATRKAGQLGDPRARATLLMKRGVGHMHSARFRDGLELVGEGLRMFEDSCTGVAWEISQARAFTLSMLWYVGDLAESAVRGPRWIRSAEERGDLYGSLWLRLYYAPVLAAEAAPEAAEMLLRTTLERAAQCSPGTTGLHVMVVFLLCELHLYRGEPERVLELLDALWKRAEASFVLSDSLARIFGLYLRGVASLALARQQPPEQKRLRAQARKCATRLRRERSPLAPGPAALLRAGLAHAEGDLPRALSALDEAIAAYEAAEQVLRATVARWRKAELLGGEAGQVLMREASAAMRARGIRDVERWALMYSAGFPGPQPLRPSE